MDSRMGFYFDVSEDDHQSVTERGYSKSRTALKDAEQAKLDKHFKRSLRKLSEPLIVLTTVPVLSLTSCSDSEKRFPF